MMIQVCFFIIRLLYTNLRWRKYTQLILYIFFTGTCECSIWGDPHINSFDKVFFDFQGDCEYTLVKPCGESDLPDFELIGNFFKNSPNDKYSYIREMRLVLGGKVYELLHKGRVLVDGVEVPLPYNDKENGVEITPILWFVVSR